MLIVQKFGGISVKTLEGIKNCALIAKQKLDGGDQVVVVVSARMGETDRLISYFAEITQNMHLNSEMLAERDSILSTGEISCAGFFAGYLNSIGIRARSFSGPQTGIFTNSTFFNAKILQVDTDEIEKALSDGLTPVVAGFQGFCLEKKMVTTLGRGGSDTSAIAIAASLNADKCELYKDVEGILTGDPKIITNPKKILEIKHDKMADLSSGGARVLETRAVHFAAKYKVPVKVLSSLSQSSGTKIKSFVNEHFRVQAISFSENYSLYHLNVEGEVTHAIKKLEKDFSIFKILKIERMGENAQISSLILRSEEKKVKEAIPVFSIKIVGNFLTSDKVLLIVSEILSQFKLKVVLSLCSETQISLFLKDQPSKEFINKMHDKLISLS